MQSIEVGEGYEINCLAFSPDGETLATGSYYDPINLWDVRSGEKKHTLILEEQQLYSLAFSPDGSTLAAGYYDKKLVLWDTRSGVKIDTLEGEGTAYTGFSKDGSRLVSASIYDVSLWDAERKTLINRFETTHSSGINDTAISSDGQIIATAANDETIMLWDTTGTQVATLEGHSDDVIDLVYLQSGTELVSASSNEVILWDINAGTAQDIIQGFTGQVLSLAFAPAGNALATGSW